MLQTKSANILEHIYIFKGTLSSPYFSIPLRLSRTHPQHSPAPAPCWVCVGACWGVTDAVQQKSRCLIRDHPNLSTEWSLYIMRSKFTLFVCLFFCCLSHGFTGSVRASEIGNSFSRPENVRHFTKWQEVLDKASIQAVVY